MKESNLINWPAFNYIAKAMPFLEFPVSTGVFSTNQLQIMTDGALRGTPTRGRTVPWSLFAFLLFQDSKNDHVHVNPINISIQFLSIEWNVKASIYHEIIHVLSLTDISIA